MFCRIFIKFGIDVLFERSSDQEFRENRLGESSAWVSDVNEFLPVFSVILDGYE